MPAASPSACRTARGAGHEALVNARNQLLGMAAQEQDADAGAARRAGRRAAAADRHRPRQGQRAGRDLRRDQRDAVDRARLDLRQRLPEPGPPAARGGAGRCAGAHAARRPAEAERQQHARASRCRCRPSPARAGSPARSRRCATTATRRCASRARRRRATARAPRWPRWNSWPRSCRRASASNGPASRAKKSSPARRPSSCTASRSWRCSCAWPRCTRAGRSRWR